MAHTVMANIVMAESRSPLERAAMLVEPRRHRLELADRRRDALRRRRDALLELLQLGAVVRQHRLHLSRRA